MHSALPEIAAIVNFIALVIILFFLTKKPVKTFMAVRSDEIRKNVEESERLQQEALAMLKNYEERLSKLDGEINSMMNEARKEGEKEKEEILSRAKRMSDQIIENAKSMAERELVRQKNNLQRELMNKVIAEAREVLKKKTSEKDHQQFVAQFINQMETKHGDIN